MMWQVGTALSFSHSILYLFDTETLEAFLIRIINFPHLILEQSISRGGNIAGEEMEASGENRGGEKNRDRVGNEYRNRNKYKPPYKNENHIRAGREPPGTELGKQPSFHFNTISQAASASFFHTPHTCLILLFSGLRCGSCGMVSQCYGSSEISCVFMHARG